MLVIPNKQIADVLTMEFPGWRFDVANSDIVYAIVPNGMSLAEVEEMKPRIRERIAELRNMRTEVGESKTSDTLTGYQITRQISELTNETAPHCLTCVARDGLLVWDHAPIIREVAEHNGIKCDVCGQLLIVDYLQRQIGVRDKVLKELASFLAYDLGGCNGPDWWRIRELQKQIEPFAG